MPSGDWVLAKPPLRPAHAMLCNAEIYCVKPYDELSLAFALHEEGHFWLRHFPEEEARTRTLRYLYTSRRQPLTDAEQEYECERWVAGVMRAEGFKVTREVIGHMRENIAEGLDLDTLKKKSPRHVRRAV